jgi:hypothetical protein
MKKKKDDESESTEKKKKAPGPSQLDDGNPLIKFISDIIIVRVPVTTTP